MASAWVFQVPSQVVKHGADKASWYLGWYDLEGKQRSKSHGPGDKGKEKAERERIKLEDQLERGTYQADAKKKWADFKEEYTTKVASRLALRSREEVSAALAHFERLARPGKVSAIKTATLDDFIAKRRAEQGKNKGATVSPATVNKDLRHVKAALAVAHEWGYLPVVPKVRMLREDGKLPSYIPPEHFQAIYQHCKDAKRPAGQNYDAADWWRALLVMGYMTGWRIGALLALRREDVNLETGEATSWAKDNKGKRDVRVKLHPVVVDHLRKLPGFDPCIFPWNHNKTTLYKEFFAIQKAAGVKLVCHERHEHTDACGFYGFHDLRRAFATLNAEKLTPDALQALMQHKSYSTTQRYINMARQLDAAVAQLHVPDVLKVAAQG